MTNPTIGDQDDMVARLTATLPPRWFPDAAPVLQSVLTGLGSTAAWLYAQLQYLGQQTRIATATDGFLDLIATDFFGARIARRPNEQDSSFRSRIQHELLRERATRAAVISALVDLTGRTPSVFEPSRPTDTGAYGIASGYGIAGGWGSLALPFQALLTAYRPQGAGVAIVAGYGTTAAGYGEGPIEYASLTQLGTEISDQDIYAAIAAVTPVSTTAWTSIRS